MSSRIRPTSGKVKLALFSTLGPLEGRSFLDLFSGTGQIAFEAARRGASPVVAVELLREQRKSLVQEGKPLGVEVLISHVPQGVRYLCRKGRRFDIIFADPPYLEGWPPVVVELLESHASLLAPGGVIVLEHSKREPCPEGFPGMERREKQYGETLLTYFHASPEPLKNSEGGERA